MFRLYKLSIILISFFTLFLLIPEISSSQLIDSVSSEHVVMRMPEGRESLGRDLIPDIERCYIFMNRATNASLPRKIAVVVNWDLPDSSYNQRDASIIVGMNKPDPAANLRALLLHNVGREIARFGLIELSQGAQREDTEFLFEGMSEILMHEFEHSSRSLDAAWAVSRLLDDMQMLGFSTQRSWSSFSGGKRCFRNAAPGITFLTTFRELQGRERPMKLFEALGKTSLTKSLESAFKAPIAEIENVWLKRVREYRVADEITVAAEEAPKLLQTAYVPDISQPGTTLQVRLFFKDFLGNLLTDGIFVQDERTSRVLQAQAASEKDGGYVVVMIPIESNCPPGQYNFQITAIDESGNLRRWTGSYKVVSQ
jgi:hypothetical protein